MATAPSPSSRLIRLLPENLLAPEQQPQQVLPSQPGNIGRPIAHPAPPANIASTPLPQAQQQQSTSKPTRITSASPGPASPIATPPPDNAARTLIAAVMAQQQQQRAGNIGTGVFEGIAQNEGMQATNRSPMDSPNLSPAQSRKCPTSTTTSQLNPASQDGYMPVVSVMLNMVG